MRRDIDISSTDDTIDIRNVIARVEELETELQDAHETIGVLTFRAWLKEASEDDANTLQDGARELLMLLASLDDCRGNGGDEQWRGDWYPVTLIRDSYFTEYAEELANDIGAVASEASWPNRHIDWKAAADELKQDYTSVEFDGVTYWTR